jgi:carbon-monoxide dehydrogenase small subunit
MRDTRENGSKTSISFVVNGDPKTVRAYPMERLLDVLRHQLQLTGTKEGCGEGECGSCSVVLDGMLVNSCLIPVLQAQGSSIVTIEGISAGDTLHILQQTFLEHGGAQCGICTPGMILASVHLLNGNPEPSLEEIREGLSGNLCRCTGYSQIIEAVAEASRRKATA